MSLPSNYNHIEFDSIDSTNLEAKRLIQGGRHGDFIISAKTQTAGRGRLERSWISNEGNLFVSIVKVGVANPILPFIAALAVGDTIQEFIKDIPLYKWPNDVLVAEKKISGILIETINNHAIIGIGINIVNHPESGTKLPATCLNKHSEKVITANEVLELLVCNIDKRLKAGQGDILRDWTLQAYKINKNVTILQGEKEISGIYKGVDENGRLILETNQGTRELVLYGDVVF